MIPVKVGKRDDRKYLNTVNCNLSSMGVLEFEKWESLIQINLTNNSLNSNNFHDFIIMKFLY